MTESEWNTCDNPKAMLHFVADKKLGSERKFRLFTCACFRRVWSSLSDDRAKKAIEVAERYADDQASDEERQQVLTEAAQVRYFGANATRFSLYTVARTGAMMGVDAAGQTAASPPGQEYDS